jgi:hypothetical protein
MLKQFYSNCWFPSRVEQTTYCDKVGRSRMEQHEHISHTPYHTHYTLRAQAGGRLKLWRPNLPGRFFLSFVTTCKQRSMKVCAPPEQQVPTTFWYLIQCCAKNKRYDEPSPVAALTTCSVWYVAVRSSLHSNRLAPELQHACSTDCDGFSLWEVDNRAMSQGLPRLFMTPTMSTLRSR